MLIGSMEEAFRDATQAIDLCVDNKWEEAETLLDAKCSKWLSKRTSSTISKMSSYHHLMNGIFGIRGVFELNKDGLKEGRKVLQSSANLVHAQRRRSWGR